MFSLKITVIATSFWLMTGIGVEGLDTTNCDTPGWFYPDTCSPVGCQMVSNPPCNHKPKIY